MKVIVVRTGGLGNVKRKAERDYGELTPEQRGELDAVINQAKAETSPDPGADHFVFTIEIQDEGGSRRLTFPESRMPKELKKIVMG